MSFRHLTLISRLQTMPMGIHKRKALLGSSTSKCYTCAGRLSEANLNPRFSTQRTDVRQLGNDRESLWKPVGDHGGSNDIASGAGTRGSRVGRTVILPVSGRHTYGGSSTASEKLCNGDGIKVSALHTFSCRVLEGHL